jgi:DNA-binding beta-propeller fold protein YncE
MINGLSAFPFAFSQARFFAFPMVFLAVCMVVSPGTAATHGKGTHGMLLVANKGDHTLGLIDPIAQKQIATVPEDGVTGHEVAASPDGKLAFVPIYGNSGVGKAGTDGQVIRVIDLRERKITGTIDFGKGVRPHCAVVGPKDGLLYVTTELENSISIIDPQTLIIVGSIPTGQPESHMLAITRDGRKGYTANVGPGTVSVLDMKARKTLKVIPICKVTQRISISPDNRWVFTSDQQQPRLAIIDSKTDELSRWIDMPATGYGTAPTPDGKYLVVALSKAGKVGVIDLRAMKLIQAIQVPRAPQEVVITPDGSMAYVSCDASKQVAAIRTKDWAVDALIDAGAGADGLAWAPPVAK